MTQPHSGGPTGSPTSQPDTPAESIAAIPSVPRQVQSATSSPAVGSPHQNAGAPRRKRGALVASVALAVILVLGASGGVVAFLTLRTAENGTGAQEPTAAVEAFLTAVYRDRDADRAAALVCSAARDDEKIVAKVAEVEKYAANYRNPRFRWSTPRIDNQTGDRATVTTKVTMTTADEKIADLPLRFTVIRKSGWWVCEVG
ncbi:hypothetical protein QTQ03_17530 [Micromonospora sp. WMMA1363]|uniref:Rv0361 family membrane protein n=1 Tax=Micromonospora sp. WMMA1363 TaxID=3053985 RepID=UPI00259C9F26|nr:hypothetical protein [Micromonospora sp. WMMA1363]MDM4721317.1 hypothetical protein [Micromonospora sp. WMMA1363]